MENLTLGQVVAAIAFIVGAIQGIKYLIKDTRHILTTEIHKSVTNQLEPLTKNINQLSNQVCLLDIGQCKNFLVRFLADIETGTELDKSEVERAYEIFDHYTKDLKQNSYIHKRWYELMEKEKD